MDAMPRPSSVQYLAFGVVASGAIGLTLVQAQMDVSVYRPYLGRVAPAAATITASAVGLIVMAYLMSRSQFVVFDRSSAGESALFIAKTVPLFAAVAIGADLIWRHPEDINVPLPDALFFYPSIGFIVEVFLHALPLALLIVVFGRGAVLPERHFWMMAVAVASIEAVFQALAGRSSPGLAVVTGLALLAFGIVQLFVFRRFGFISMYMFRIAYYALWHVGWGAARLHVLF